jgi:hypothetical protein
MSMAKRWMETLPEFDEVVEVIQVEPAFDTVAFMAAFQPHLTPADLRQLRHEGWLDDTEVGVKLFESGYGSWHCDNIDEYEGWHKAQTAATAYNRKMEFAE